MDWKKVIEILKNKKDFRIEQAKRAVFKERIRGWEEATTLPESLRTRLQKEAPLKIKGKTIESKNERVKKALITLKDGEKVESVLMKHGENHNTVCVSSQIGCPLKCAFCLTGKMGFKRNLTASEIVVQVLFFQRLLGEKPVSNVVFMGMGEPFLNYENVLKAIEMLNDPEGLKIGARKISLSTVGIPQKIKSFAEFPIQANLAVSLHAPSNLLRNRLIPINRKHPIEEVFEAVDFYIKKTNRKVMIEYLMLKGVNDNLKQAQKLFELVQGKLVMINLISYNPTGDFKPSPQERISRFKGFLNEKGIETVQRYKFGRDIKAACGQLANKNN